MRLNMMIRGILMIALASFFVAPQMTFAAPQQQGPVKPPQTQQQQPQYTLTVQSRVVQVNTVVTDQDGNIVTGLKKENFRITDNGQPQQIVNFEPNDAPITIVILLDFDARFYQIFSYYSQEIAYGFAPHLGPQDWVALVTFDLKPKIVVDFTKNKQEIQNGIATLGFPGFSESNLFDALIDTLDRLKDVQGKKAILLIAPGDDTFSKHTLSQTYDALKQTNVTVFCIGSIEQLTVTSPNEGGIGYLQAKNQMEYFARLTGGYAWFPRFQGELPDDFNDVVAFLRNQYSLGFLPPDSARDGKYHKIKLEVVDDKGNPLMVEGKKGKMKKVVVYAREGYQAPKAEVGD
ncbi:MAG TPA: VWA domain-containing protein [Candidatus Acidoferrales bacterium]|nr:VWA domain-containing protein [Candidatus Acidoferrales bacterium]